MNIHEHQAKQILEKYGAPVPKGVFGLSVNEAVEKAKNLETKKYVLKAQIHAGGRGKAGGVKILDNLQELEKAAKKVQDDDATVSTNIVQGYTVVPTLQIRRSRR